MQHAANAAPARPALCQCESPVCPRAHAARRREPEAMPFGVWRRPRLAVAVVTRTRHLRRISRHG